MFGLLSFRGLWTSYFNSKFHGLRMQRCPQHGGLEKVLHQASWHEAVYLEEKEDEEEKEKAKERE